MQSRSSQTIVALGALVAILAGAWLTRPNGLQTQSQSAPASAQQATPAPPPPDKPIVVTAPPPPAPEEPKRPPTQPNGHRDVPLGIAVSPDGKTFITGSADKSVKLWSLASAAPLRDLAQHGGIVRTTLFLRDGRILTAGDDKQIVLRSTADGKPYIVFNVAEHGDTNSLAVSGDGSMLVSGQAKGTLLVWDLKTGAVKATLSGHQGRAAAVALTPDGKLALSGGIDQTVRIWDIQTGKQRSMLSGHGQGVYGIAVSPDGKLVVSGSGDRTIKVWDIATGRDLRTLSGHNGTIYALEISPDGRAIASASLDGTAKLWNLATGDLITTFREDNASLYSVPLYSIAFVGNERLLTGARDGSIRLWEIKSGKMLLHYPGNAPQR